MAEGTVKWFNDAKGFGFITNEESRDVFVHYSAIRSEGHRSLLQGERVTYSEQAGSRGLFAADVTRLGVD